MISGFIDTETEYQHAHSLTPSASLASPIGRRPFAQDLPRQGAQYDRLTATLWPMLDLWLEQRREGVEQGEAEIAGFIDAVLQETASPAQIGAWLAFVASRGMTAQETLHLTRAMTLSGPTLRWAGIPGPFVDKHSTGGVGDKVSLVLAPLWASLGLRVPMLSGRGLGITGGTLDKLESIPGYRTDLPRERLHRQLADVGCFINGQTAEIAPADRILYALRNETGTVPSIPLITASILSKKLVANLDTLVLDVKHGSGAFMKTEEQAEALAESLCSAGNGFGTYTTARLSDMSQPLGDAVGNSLEVEEAVATLQGNGPSDLVDLVVALSGQGDDARQVLADGRAFQVWQRMVAAQGGEPEAPLRGQGCERQEVRAEASGVVTRCDAGAIGRAAFRLGAGRLHAYDPILPGVGIQLHAKRGSQVKPGQVLAVVVHAGRGVEEACNLVEQAYSLS